MFFSTLTKIALTGVDKEVGLQPRGLSLYAQTECLYAHFSDKNHNLSITLNNRSFLRVATGIAALSFMIIES